MDFTLSTYKSLIKALKKENYQFLTVEEYFFHSLAPSHFRTVIPSPSRPVALSHRHPVVIMRHDVDSWPLNALQMAEIENELGIKATYYFRKSPLSLNEKIIKKIIELGHEIGYHYEDLATNNGNFQKAIDSFKKNLEFLRNYYPIKTIAMHGRPLSKWDSKDLWKKFDYKDYGLIGEPYLDIDFNKVLYLTDTGNCWDGHKFSVRDYVSAKFKFKIHSTFDLIDHLKKNELPAQIMLNIHPARWNDNLLKWFVRFYILTLPKKHIKMLVKKIRK